MTYQPHPPAADTLVATLTADEQSARRGADIFADAFFADEVAVSVVDNGHGQWRLAIYFHREIDVAQVRDVARAAAGAELANGLRFERIAARDWVAESLLGLKPVTAGRFVVHGAHDRGCAAPNRIAIEIEAALAFGTGHHGSTRGCLLALDRLCKSLKSARLKQRFPRVLDLGTGSGVLAIAAARIGWGPVSALELDPDAAAVIAANAAANGVEIDVRAP